MKAIIIFACILSNYLLLPPLINTQSLTLNFQRVPIVIDETTKGKTTILEHYNKFLKEKSFLFEEENWQKFNENNKKLTPLQIRDLLIEDLILSNKYLSNPDIPTNFTPIEINLLNNKIDQMIIDMNIGTPTQSFKVLADTGSSVLWVANQSCSPCGGVKNKFNSALSTTYVNTSKKINLNYGSGHAYGFGITETVAFSDQPIASNPNFSLVLANDISFDYSDGILGLSYNCSEGEEFSFIDSLKKRGIISNRIISQKYTETNKGLLIIGDYPPEVKEVRDGNILASCPLLKTYSSIETPFWSCELHGVFGGNDESAFFALKESIIFDTGSNFNYVTDNFWQFLKEKFLVDYIQKGICKERPNGFSSRIIQCNDVEELANMPPIHFVFGQWSFFMTKDQILQKDLTSGLLLCNFITLLFSSDFIMGEKFLKNFISIHNKEEKLFQLYGKNIVKMKKDHTPPAPDPKPSDSSDPFATSSKDSDSNAFPGYGIFLIILGSVILLAVIIVVVTRIAKYYKDRSRRNFEYMAFNDAQIVDNNRQQNIASPNQY